MFSTKIAAVLAALSASTLATDVYTQFYASDGHRIGSTSYDVSNTGCFTVNGATSITFSQSGNSGTATGPYCLYSFTEGNCGGGGSTQQFSSVNLHGQHYELKSGVADAPSFMWQKYAC